MVECDRQLNHYLKQREDRSQGVPLPEEKRKGRLKKKSGNKPQFDLRTGLFRMSGTDLTRVDGIDVMTATTILSEAGWDMSKWVTEDHPAGRRALYGRTKTWDRLQFRFLVAAVSGQSYQREQGHWERAAANQQQGDHRFKDGGQHLAAKRYPSGSAVPSIQNQVRSSRCNQGHGSQACPLGLPHALLRDEIRRQRSGALPGAAPAVTDQAAQ